MNYLMLLLLPRSRAILNPTSLSRSILKARRALCPVFMWGAPQPQDSI
jgi:hypothetical protein